MKKKLFLTAILTLLCCTLLIAGASADLEGTGTADDPYEISSAQDLIDFASKVNDDDNDACAVLTDNIDLNGNENNQWTPIGGSTTYKGTFDGKGHTISGLYYSGSGDYVGLFGAISSGGTVKNVSITDSYMEGSGTFYIAGGVCGFNNGGTIENCSFDGIVKGSSNSNTKTGGVCGSNSGTIKNCSFTGTVSGYTVGGVCGQNDDGGTIKNCYWLDKEGSIGIGADGAGTAMNVVGKSDECFASGEVAWLLNQGQTDGPWRQDLNTDTYPVLDSTHKEVVKLTVDSVDSYLNKGEKFEGMPGKAYLDETGKRIGLPYTVTKDTTLTSKILVTVTADDLVIYVGDESPDPTFTTSPEVVVNGVIMFYDLGAAKPGEYPILIDGPKVQGDYAFDYVYGKLTVLQSWIVTVDGEMYYVHPGESFTLPDAPSRPGYIFMGWRSGDMTYLPGDEVGLYGDTTFTSVWANMPDMTPTEPDEPDEPDKPDEPTQPTEVPFADVSEGAWYYDAVKVVFDAGLMKGVSDTDFNPNGTLNRAMVWTMLARVDGAATDGGATWYSVAQAWAVENGVSDGADAMGALTREQLVTMLWRLNGEPVVNYLITTPDANQISSWALEAMRWAASIGLIEGDETGALDPTAMCTRAQAATFLVRYLTTE